MKTKNIKYLLFGFLFLPIVLISQEDTRVSEPPAPPELEFNFDFQNFPGMSKEEEKELLKSLKKDLRDELKVIKNFDKQKYFNFLRESQFKNMNIPFIVKREKLMHEREKKIFELEVKTESLAAKFEKAGKSEREKIKKELKQKLDKLFDEKEENRKQEVKELQNELLELQKSLEVRLKNKKEIINRRLQELLHEDKYLDWE